MELQNLYESKFSCISKAEVNKDTKIIYQKRLSEIFQCERKIIDFLIIPYQFKDSNFGTVKSTINYYIKNKTKPNPQEKNAVNLNTFKKETKKAFCSLNKNENFKNINFLDQIGEFFDKTLYFLKYVNNIYKIENSNYDTKIVEFARCGYNMGEILKNLGYEEQPNKNLKGCYYNYKYFPIICYYVRFEGDANIFLQVSGYYTENTKKEIIEELDKIKKQLSDLFYIKI